MGEFGLIQRLGAVVGAPPPDDLLVGIGDDAAAWRAGGTVLLATTDTLVEGVHFLARTTPWADVGWKALAVNVSDIAAMGGEPLFALVTLALPPQTPVDAIDQLYSGLGECACEYRVTVAGGDIVRAPQFSVTVALIGRAQMHDGEPLLMLRDGAQAGDTIAVSGCLGDSAGGLRRLREGAARDEPLVRTHLRPRPPLHLAQSAVRLGIACAIDVSDGLVQDLSHICEMSRAGAAVRADDIPLSDELRSAYAADAVSLACTGGEDYQMLFTAPAALIERLRETSGARLTAIGEVTDSPDRKPRLLDSSGREVPLPSAGWDHLRNA